MTRGITYVAWGKCIPEAERSSASAKKFDLKTCLITQDNYLSDHFDFIIRTKDRLSQSFNIVNTYDLSPWDQTLWLDSDTLILGDLSYAFDKSSQYGIALAIAPHASLLGRALKGIHPDAPEYNCGAVWIDRNNEIMHNFGKKWLQIVEAYDGGGWWSDQSSLSCALHQLCINPFVLPLNWNFRAFMNNEFNKGEFHTNHGFGPVKIWHSRTPVPNDFNINSDWFWSLESYIKDHRNTL